MKRRFIAYGLVIVLAVAAGLWTLSLESVQPFLSGNKPAPDPSRGRTPPPSTPFAPSADDEAAANDKFSVETSRSDNASLAGKKSGADWPQFNGRNRDNKSSETGLLQAWPEGGPPLLWTVRGLGEGYSTVAVVDGVVYTLGNKGNVEAFIAIDAGTGEKIWSAPFAWASRLSNGNGPRGTPAVSGDAVYGLGGNGDLACLDARTGQVRWRKNILTEFGGGVLGWGICESVLIDQDRLICTPGGSDATIVALDPESGDVIWKSLIPDKDRAAYASPAVADVGGVRQYVQLTASGTIGVRANDGEFLWRDNSAANGTANCSSPLVAGDFVFSASNYGTGGALVKLSADGESVSAECVYHTRDMKNHHGDMVIVDGLLFGSNDPGILTCLDLESGDVKWKDRSVGKGAVTYADGRVYLRSEAGKVALVEATGDSYREHGRFDEPARSNSNAWSHPVVAHGRLFLRDQDRLLCYDVRAGAK